ncbi:TetR/AcrR family transcriptional regulator [Lacisediminihabitans profunda]|uniref:TetR/AcrR family transcriptional regulator n=1 Tax=Lacisediminihabitans profunda TaxID=2594790 RepID=A0A5C8URN9_9MICO|nr:TetR/AcrR family transcriptional regulator [Lacisediminihabitans profunda]TXN30625.1 TetR/AcrR family transcriptional regulator [Lacisediminihabitans profunda]
MTTDVTDRTQRVDAQRNRAAIIDAALACLSANPRASMAEIARAAGVGRVTLYGHFSSRRELVEAASVQAIGRAEVQLAPLDLDGDPREALRLLVTTSWRLVDDFQGLIGAAEQELGADRVREHHDETMLRVRRLMERGQASGQFRSDQSADWLTACFFAILHGAATEIRLGRLGEDEADRLLPDTIQALVSVPA